MLQALKKNILLRILNRGKWGTTFQSYTHALIRLCGLYEWDTIVEFGPGYSTQLLLKYTPVRIYSFETDEKWYKKYRNLFEQNRVQVILRPPDWDLNEIIDYPDPISMFFIDGGDRVAALRVAYKKLPQEGIAFLHDAHREDYEIGIRLFPFIYFPERHSCILTKSYLLYERIRDEIKPDYSCNCVYCSTPERRAYFNQFLEISPDP